MKILNLILLISFFTILNGQNSSLSGKVIDASNGTPLIGANVMIDGTSLGAATDENGKYLIENLKDLSNQILLAKKQNDYNKIIAIDNDRRIIIDQIFSIGIKALSEADINIVKIIAEENENLISEISVATTKSIEKANIKMKAIKGYNL